MSVPPCLRAVADGVELSVFCQPGTTRSAVVGLHGGALKVKVRAVALGGKANAELLALLADQLGVSRGVLSLAAGEQSRNKRVLARGCTLAGVGPTLQALIDAGQSDRPG